MKEIIWDKNKNDKLKKERNVSFEECCTFIENRLIIDKIRHHNLNKYPGQWIYIIKINNYIYEVPFEENDAEIILKTIYPSRKYNKIYLQKKYEKDKQ